MALIVGTGVGKAYGPHKVLKNLSFQVNLEDHIGLIGANGCGKTTLMKLMGGLETPSDGTIQSKRGLRVGYLPQDPPAIGDQTLWQCMLDVFADLRAMETAIHDLSAQITGGHAEDELLDQLGEMQHQFESGGGYRYVNQIETVLTGLEFGPEYYDKPLSQFSGGQRTRALLGKLLLEDPEILLLDEPTNHLDLQTVQWLEQFLQTIKGCLVVVSHDRQFLDKVCNGIWEIGFGSLETYPGNYTAYTQQRKQRQTELMRRWESQQQYVEKTEEYIRRFLAGQRSSQAKGRRTRLERFKEQDAIARPQEQQEILLRLAPSARSGDLIYRAENLSVGYEAGKPLLRAENLEVRRLDRVAIIGGNGVGKTTLVRTLMGELEPLGGTIKRGASMQIGHLSQTHADLRGDWTVLEAILDADKNLKPAQARQLLGTLLFSGEDAFKTISQLSGGQRSRVVLGRLRAQGANVLLLDEPTNHLDLASRETLQDVLKDFDGTILFVSHDRYLVKALATSVWVLENGTVHSIQGGWDEYLRWQAKREKIAKEQPSREEKNTSPAPAKRGPSARDDARKQKRQQERLQKQHDEIEQQIHLLESSLSKLTEDINIASQAGDMDKVRQLGNEYEESNAKLKTLWEQWEQIGAEIEKGKSQTTE